MGIHITRAYDEIRQELEILGFEWTQGSLYVNSTEKKHFS